MMNAEILREAEQRRFAWRCRRGLLELDIVLQNFVLYQYDTLTLDELQTFDALLALPDNEFWGLINNAGALAAPTSAKEKARNAMIGKIRDARFNQLQGAQ